MGFQVTEVQKSLTGFEDLGRQAEVNGGGSGLVEALRSLQEMSFDGPNAVMHSLSEDDVLGGSTSSSS